MAGLGPKAAFAPHGPRFVKSLRRQVSGPRSDALRASAHGRRDPQGGGFDERTIADALGQKTIEMARHYARGADLKRKMRAVVTKWDAEVNRRRTEALKPDR